jgi:hypothetical protein
MYQTTNDPWMLFGQESCLNNGELNSERQKRKVLNLSLTLQRGLLFKPTVDKSGISHACFEEAVAEEELHEIPSIATHQNARTAENHTITNLNSGSVLQTKETN